MSECKVKVKINKVIESTKFFDRIKEYSKIMKEKNGTWQPQSAVVSKLTEFKDEVKKIITAYKDLSSIFHQKTTEEILEHWSIKDCCNEIYLLLVSLIETQPSQIMIHNGVEFPAGIMEHFIINYNKYKKANVNVLSNIGLPALMNDLEKTYQELITDILNFLVDTGADVSKEGAHDYKISQEEVEKFEKLLYEGCKDKKDPDDNPFEEDDFKGMVSALNNIQMRKNRKIRKKKHNIHPSNRTGGKRRRKKSKKRRRKTRRKKSRKRRRKTRRKRKT